MFKTTSFDEWRREEGTSKIITLCKQLDDNLGGGIALKTITELCGSPGVGKTQMCLQLCLNVQFPKIVGGLGGKAIYIDTNQDFNPKRLKEIAEHISHRLTKTLNKIQIEDANKNIALTVDNLLDNILYVYCADSAELLAAIINLKSTIEEEKEIKLIVIDSFGFTMRQNEDYTERTQLIYDILTELQEKAWQLDFAIVITNELTTYNNGIDWDIRPALGDTHGHKINQRIILSKDSVSGLHVATLEKSLLTPKLTIPFQITPNGIRGVT